MVGSLSTSNTWGGAFIICRWKGRGGSFLILDFKLYDILKGLESKCSKHLLKGVCEAVVLKVI